MRMVAWINRETDDALEEEEAQTTLNDTGSGENGEEEEEDEVFQDDNDENQQQHEENNPHSSSHEPLESQAWTIEEEEEEVPQVPSIVPNIKQKMKENDGEEGPLHRAAAVACIGLDHELVESALSRTSTPPIHPTSNTTTMTTTTTTKNNHHHSKVPYSTAARQALNIQEQRHSQNTRTFSRRSFDSDDSEDLESAFCDEPMYSVDDSVETRRPPRRRSFSSSSPPPEAAPPRRNNNKTKKKKNQQTPFLAPKDKDHSKNKKPQDDDNDASLPLHDTKDETDHPPNTLWYRQPEVWCCIVFVILLAVGLILLAVSGVVPQLDPSSSSSSDSNSEESSYDTTETSQTSSSRRPANYDIFTG